MINEPIKPNDSEAVPNIGEAPTIDLDKLYADMNDRTESGYLIALQGINKKRLKGIIDKMKAKSKLSEEKPPVA